ncbi:LexA family protein [Desulfurivibrio sp. C05AmB]|uniref:LexA family protein n=1 Tax=Desulfurivibrio sp. C05AmB TaxID=3374371 RepID=UPI00376EB618
MKISPIIAAVYGFNRKTELKRPLFAGGVSAGFPSPADDYIDSRLDLNDFLVKHAAATFFVRVAGDSMIGAGIHDGDILVVDRSLEPVSGKVVIAVVNGELTVKRLQQENGLVRLVAENPNYPPIELTEETAGEIWGVVTSVIHSL